MEFEEALKLHSKFNAQTRHNEVGYLYNTVIDTPKGDVVEIGSACGGTTIVLIAAAEKVNKMVYSVDPYPEKLEKVADKYTPGIMKNFKETFKNNILTGKWNNIIQYNVDITDCIDKIPDNLSVVFIDGCHEYSYVLNEYNMLFPKLVKNGKMFIHDCKGPIGQISRTKDTGVSNIVDDFCKTFRNIVIVGSMLGGTK
jgi:predicted O-methyltransferase YrrM